MADKFPLPEVHEDGSCSKCGSKSDMLMAEDSTDYSTVSFKDGQWVKSHSGSEPSAADDAVRFYCANCGTYHAVPEALK